MRVFAVDKPLGLSSHDVVARARRQLATRRVGHAGTLDPLASGVLVLLVDEATKLAPFLSGADKRYLAWVALGVGTATLDAEGPAEAHADATHIDAAALAAELPRFLELREQLPPAYSAVQRGGERAYAAARRGAALDLPPRPARYLELELIELLPKGSPAATRLRQVPDGWRPLALPEPLADTPTALIDLRVAAGTYVRSFARDLGAALGVPAHLAGLVRTGAGSVDLREAAPLEELARAEPLDPVTLLPYPQVRLDEGEVREVRDGKRLPVNWTGRAALLDGAGRLVAVADAVDGHAHTRRVWRA